AANEKRMDVRSMNMPRRRTNRISDIVGLSPRRSLSYQEPGQLRYGDAEGLRMLWSKKRMCPVSFRRLSAFIHHDRQTPRCCERALRNPARVLAALPRCI